MNGIHDMGGMHGFGPIPIEHDEPVFHEGWEGRCFALALGYETPQQWNGDRGRYAIERMNPADYVNVTYYERWLHELQTALIECNVLTREEIEARMARLSASPE